MDLSGWEQRLLNKRKGKDHFFKTHPQSPLPWPDRKVFEGLAYYPLEPDLRFELELEEYPEKETVRLDASHDETREYLRWGRFNFSIDARDQVLHAYKSEPSDGRLFVPFRDETSREETYPKGRYLDLEPELHLLDDGRWIVDFNEAHNPWCDYSQDYVCPYAPDENRLDVPIRAGEKRFPRS
jgi:uncharacterized protein (DUF1684 family)